MSSRNWIRIGRSGCQKKCLTINLISNGTVFCGPEHVAPVNISVRENRIGSAAFVEDNVPVAVEGLKRYRTIDGLFDLLQEGIDKNAHTFSAEYHSELGYPIKGSIDYEKDKRDEELSFEIDSLLIE